MVSVDEQLRSLINEVRRHQDPSLERQKALNRLLIVIQKFPGIYKSSHQDYAEALNLTWGWVCRNICEFEPRSSSIQQSLVTWINGYLKWRVKDLYSPDKNYSISLDDPIGNEEGKQITRGENFPHPQFTLDLLEQKIRKVQEAERFCLGKRIKEYIEQDEQGKLTTCHPRQHPECNCQLLAERIILHEPPHKIADIARDFNVNNQTLHSHWKKKCLPLLREIGTNLGYDP